MRGQRSKSAADVAAMPYAVVLPMVLDRLEDRRSTLRVALKNDWVLVAKGNSERNPRHIEYTLQVRIDGLDQCDGGTGSIV